MKIHSTWRHNNRFPERKKSCEFENQKTRTKWIGSRLVQFIQNETYCRSDSIIIFRFFYFTIIIVLDETIISILKTTNYAHETYLAKQFLENIDWVSIFIYSVPVTRFLFVFRIGLKVLSVNIEYQFSHQ